MNVSKQHQLEAPRRSREWSIPFGFATATLVWAIAFVGRSPFDPWSNVALLASLLGAMLAGAIFAGWWSGRIGAAIAALIVAGFVNVLLVGSVVSAVSASASNGQSPASAEPVRVTLSGLVWIPGSLAGAAVIGAVGGFFGSLLRKLTGGRQSTTSGSIRDGVKALLAMAVVVIATTLLLIAVGGMVTSLEAGLAVPDWPRTNNYNMFLYPFTKMVGGIYYEHSHRLIGSLVGLQTLTLAIWIWWPRRSAFRAARRVVNGCCARCGFELRQLADGRCGECGAIVREDERRAQLLCRAERDPAGAALLRLTQRIPWIAILALALVIIQGLFGGLRVILVNSAGHGAAQVFTVVHALSAQLFLISLATLAWSLAKLAGADVFAPATLKGTAATRGSCSFGRFDRGIVATFIALVIGQTLFGALLRHYALDWALLAHLLGAIGVAITGLTVVTLIMGSRTSRSLRRLAIAIMALIALQMMLGPVSWWVTTRYERLDQLTLLPIVLVTAGHVVAGAATLLVAWLTGLEIWSAPAEPAPRRERETVTHSSLSNAQAGAGPAAPRLHSAIRAAKGAAG